MVALLGLAGCGFARAGDEGRATDGGRGFPMTGDFGNLVEDRESAVLQRFEVGAYAHWQAAAVSGNAGGRDFWDTRDGDWRRVRATVRATMFDSLKFLGHANFSRDEGAAGGGVEFDYFGLFLAWAELDLTRLGSAAGLDGLSVFYGKRKLTELNEEVETSINALRTVERSSFAGRVVPFRAATGTTGAWVEASRGRYEWSLGVFTTDSSPEFGDWSDGTLVVGSWKYDFSAALGVEEAVVSLGGAIQDLGGRDERYAPWDWLVTPWLRIRDGRWELRASAALGRNGGPTSVSGGAFHGLTVMPVYWLAEDRLQAVLRYEVMGSEAPDGVGLAARYARQAGGPAREGIPSLARGTGDFHHSVYGGLVWTVVPGRLTVLSGIEWQRLESRDAKIYSGVTGWFSTRLMF